MQLALMPLTEKKEVKDDKGDEGEDLQYESLGCLLEANLPTTLKHYEWKHGRRNIHVAVRVVDDDPGAIQSGHYLWPAAPALCKYLASNATVVSKPSSIIELGAGCGLVSLTALQLFHDSLQCLVTTDKDPSTLERARENYQITLQELYQREETEDEQLQSIQKLSSLPIEFELLEWGRRGLDHWKEAIMEHKNAPLEFTMVLGSDIIDCVEVVSPLFQTATQLMSVSATFFLSQSFLYDEETEIEIDNQCQKLGLERVILIDTLPTHGVRIQLFRRKDPENK